jgi:5-methylcytosine-specific restriction endonuclease McrA
MLYNPNKTAWQRDHAEYLRSMQWASVRDKVIARCGYRCQDCGAEYSADGYFDVHHNSYQRWRKSGEEFDCVLLCRRCHKDRHHKPTNMAEIERILERFLYEA